MNMNKSKWHDFHFREDTMPQVNCPRCKTGTLDRNKPFEIFETTNSSKNRN